MKVSIDQLLSLNIEVSAALKVLRAIEHRGDRVISAGDLIKLSCVKINNYFSVIEKMRLYLTKRKVCNHTELAKEIGVSRQTVQNWDSHGYLIHDGRLIDIAETLNFWEYVIMENSGIWSSTYRERVEMEKIK